MAQDRACTGMRTTVKHAATLGKALKRSKSYMWIGCMRSRGMGESVKSGLTKLFWKSFCHLSQKHFRFSSFWDRSIMRRCVTGFLSLRPRSDLGHLSRRNSLSRTGCCFRRSLIVPTVLQSSLFSDGAGSQSKALQFSSRAIWCRGEAQ